MHALLAVLEAAGEECEVRLATTARARAEHIATSFRGAVLVLWSFYSPDADAMAAELAAVRAATPEAAAWRVLHVAGGVHATAEPQHVLAPLLPLDDFPSFPSGRRYAGPVELTRGCRYACRFCQTPFMFGGRFRHRSVASVREHGRRIVSYGLRDVRFITPTSLSYGSAGPDPDLDAVESLLAGVREELPPHGRIFFGSFPSEVRPEHVARRSLTSGPRSPWPPSSPTWARASMPTRSCRCLARRGGTPAPRSSRCQLCGNWTGWHCRAHPTGTGASRPSTRRGSRRRPAPTRGALVAAARPADRLTGWPADRLARCRADRLAGFPGLRAFRACGLAGLRRAMSLMRDGGRRLGAVP